MKYYLSALAGVLLFALPTTALKVGVIPGPHADIVKKISELTSAQSLDMEIVEFNDFILPNEALEAKDIDLNSYQHEQFLQTQMTSRGYKLKAIAKTVTMPLGVYSEKIKSLEELPREAKIALPNDPTNGGRALKLLAKKGIIEINSSDNPSVLDISSNPKDLSFIELEAPLLPQSLPDVDAAIINTDWVLQAGLDPKSAITSEDLESPYVNVIAVRAGDEDREDIQKFMSLYHSQEILDFIDKTYKGAVIPAW